MRTRRLAAVLLLVLAAGCAKAPPTLSPKGEAAFYSLRAVKALDLVRDTAIDANAQTPPLLSTTDTRKVVLWHRAALRTIQAVPDGWRPVVLAALDQLQADVLPESWQRLVLYVNLLKAILAEVP